MMADRSENHEPLELTYWARAASRGNAAGHQGTGSDVMIHPLAMLSEPNSKRSEVRRFTLQRGSPDRERSSRIVE
jgi:hypothetical protein